ncbi:hypothetical protein Tco_0523460 [Tanacetum coccineum]
MSQEKEAQIKFYKTREDKEIEKVIALENKVKALDDIVYKTGQSVQTMNMLNRNCKMSFVKPEFLKKAQRVNPRLYDIGTVKFRNDQIAPILGYADLGNDLLIGSRGTDLYSITLQDTSTPNPICLMAKATSSQAWLWHPTILLELLVKRSSVRNNSYWYNPSQSIRTRRQLETNGEMCMFALTMCRTEPKNIKEAMVDSAWIKAMQEELHQFDRLDVWELVDIPLCKNVINMKWIWKKKRDEENTIIRNIAHLVAKGYA